MPAINQPEMFHIAPTSLGYSQGFLSKLSCFFLKCSHNCMSDILQIQHETPYNQSFLDVRNNGFIELFLDKFVLVSTYNLCVFLYMYLYVLYVWLFILFTGSGMRP